jgi:hypothetical protein
MLYASPARLFTKDEESYGALTLMQYTGLKDKKGNEIWEGDVIQAGFVRHEIAFRDGAFQCKKLTRDALALGLSVRRIEKIGNIYENPDILK